MENARRPYNEIAEQVNPSPPTVSNRIDRLRERGLIRRFTLDIDRSMLREGDSVFVELRVQPGATDEVVDILEDSTGVKHIFELVNSRVLFHTYMTKQGIQELIAERLSDRHILEYDVELVASSRWNPQVNEEDLVMECVLCGRSVTVIECQYSWGISHMSCIVRPALPYWQSSMRSCARLQMRSNRGPVGLSLPPTVFLSKSGPLAHDHAVRMWSSSSGSME